jgi:hypothetical protein
MLPAAVKYEVPAFPGGSRTYPERSVTEAILSARLHNPRIR